MDSDVQEDSIQEDGLTKFRLGIFGNRSAISQLGRVRICHAGSTELADSMGKTSVESTEWAKRLALSGPAGKWVGACQLQCPL